MKFLVDAQLPRGFAHRLIGSGHDAIHTLELPAGNQTTDSEIIRIAAEEDRIVVSKDADFLQSFHLFGQPSRLLLISTGNITNAELEALLRRNIQGIAASFLLGNLVELTKTDLIVHQ